MERDWFEQSGNYSDYGTQSDDGYGPLRTMGTGNEARARRGWRRGRGRGLGRARAGTLYRRNSGSDDSEIQQGRGRGRGRGGRGGRGRGRASTAQHTDAYLNTLAAAESQQLPLPRSIYSRQYDLLRALCKDLDSGTPLTLVHKVGEQFLKKNLFEKYIYMLAIRLSCVCELKLTSKE